VTIRRGTCGLAVVALILAAPAIGSVRSGASGEQGSDTQAWCAWMIRVNTKYGLMKNKHYVPESKWTVAAWKGVIDTTLAQQKHYIAIAPASLKALLAHEVAYYARVKAKGYQLTTAKLGSFTRAELNEVTDFQRTKCGIVFPAAN
jgi:hypothetical protein